MKSCILLISLISLLNSVVNCKNIDRDLTVTIREKKLLDEFKRSMNQLLPNDYMKEDIYLIRWLRASKFDLKAAQKMLKENLEWRRENNMDTILQEPLTAGDVQFQQVTNGFDKDNRPIIETWVGDWDMRWASVTGNRALYLRSLMRNMELVTSNIRKMQFEGKNVTQFYHVYDLEGYNLVQHGCPACIGATLQGVRAIEAHYPGMAHKIALINAPTILEPVLELIKLVMSPATAEIFTSFGQNKKSWRNFLLEDIDNNQLSYKLGGTLVPNIYKDE